MFASVLKFNPNHAPAGSPEGGQFTSGDSHGQSQASTGAATQGLQNGGRVSGSPVGVAASGGSDSGNGPTPLQGLPTQVKVPGLGEITVGPVQKIRDVAHEYLQSAGLPENFPTDYVKVDKERATRIAQAYDAMQHDPQNPEVKAAYSQMIKEVEAQYEAVVKGGLKIEFIDYAKNGDPYAASPRLAYLDVKNNNHLWVFSTRDGFGSDDHIDVHDNPLLAETKYQISGKPALANDLFRVVHDYFGHFKEGVGFRADGEENAWREHSAMFSPLARKAMTSETRGQNSWVNFGPYGDTNRTASAATTHFAPQKTGLLPDWVVQEGSGQPGRKAESTQLIAGFAGILKADVTNADLDTAGRVGDQYMDSSQFRKPLFVDFAKIFASSLFMGLVQKFNPNHDEHNGQFTSGAGGPSESTDRPGARSGEGISLRPHQADAISAAVTHYGTTAGLKSLSAAYYGRGIKGAEADRIAKSNDSNIKNRVYFYLNPEQGLPRKEAGLGPHVYQVKLNNLYDFAKDPAGILSRMRQIEDPAQRANFMESEIVKAGYDGYPVKAYNMAVVLGKDVPVEYKGLEPARKGFSSVLKFNQNHDPKDGQFTSGTNSAAFKEWFADSKVVGDNGEPLRVYHGTTADINAFDKTKAGSGTDYGYAGQGFYFTDSTKAVNAYASTGIPNHYDMGASVYPVYLRMENPLILKDFPEHEVNSEASAKAFTEKLRSQGHDGVIIYSGKPGDMKEFMVLSPEQIKSATGNNGQYDPKNPNITKADTMFAHILKFNPNHDPTNGQFSSGSITGSEVRDTMTALRHQDGHPNIMNLKVDGQMPFGGDRNLGIPRIDMPQIPKAERAAFIDSLGVKVETTRIDPLQLKPTQDELDGYKVAKIFHKLATGDVPKEPILVSRDNYIIDGHHHWGAYVAAKVGGLDPKATIPSYRVDMDHKELLDATRAYADAHGFKSKDITKSEAAQSIAANEGVFAQVLKFNPNHDARGRFATSDGHAGALQSILPKGLPPQAHQPFAEPEPLFAASARAIDELKAWLDQGKGVATQAGVKTMSESIDDAIADGSINKPGGMLFIAPEKSMSRSMEKVKQEYHGDWSKLLDVARASIAVDSMKDVSSIVKKLQDSGMELARQPKDRFSNPTEVGYRDLLLNVKTKSGVVAELQVHLKPMLEAKQEAHQYYETMRSLAGKYQDTPLRDWSVEDRNNFNDAVAASKKLYAAAWKKSA